MIINKWIPASDLQPPVRITPWTTEKQKRKAMLTDEINFLQAFQIADKSNTALSASRKEELSKKEVPAGLVTWVKNHPWQIGASTVAAVALGYGLSQFPAATAQMLEAKPLQLPKEWLQSAPLCSLNPPFQVGITAAPAMPKFDLPVCPSAACPVPNLYEWPQPAAAVANATYSAFDTLKWLGTGAAIVGLAAATAPLVVPVAAGSAALAALGTAAATIGMAARGAEAYQDIAAGNYGSAAFKAATVAAGPLLGGLGTLAGRAGTETMTVAARTLNDPAQMQQLSAAGWKLVDLGSKGADYLRNGGKVTNFLMEGARFVLKR